MAQYKKYETLSEKEKLEFINTHYVKNKLSFADIANRSYTYANRIRRDAKKFGIQIRDKSEAQKNALKTGKHNHPTKGQKRKTETKEKIGLSVMKSWNQLSESELSARKLKSKESWEKLDDSQKELIIASANKAVRESSKLGSKLEKFLLNNLLKDGFVVEFHKEQILSNTRLQIDLFLSILSIAIEVDGPSHFLPIWGEDTLTKNQKYDKKKTGLILGKGISLIRIKQKRDFSKSRATLVYKKLLVAIDTIQKTKKKTIEIEDS